MDKNISFFCQILRYCKVVNGLTSRKRKYLIIQPFGSYGTKVEEQVKGLSVR